MLVEVIDTATNETVVEVGGEDAEQVGIDLGRELGELLGGVEQGEWKVVVS